MAKLAICNALAIRIVCCYNFLTKCKMVKQVERKGNTKLLVMQNKMKYFLSLVSYYYTIISTNFPLFNFLNIILSSYRNTYRLSLPTVTIFKFV